MSEPVVLAQYDGNSPANLKFREIQREAMRNEQKRNAVIEHLGLLELGLDEVTDKYNDYLRASNLFSAQVMDSVRMVIQREVKQMKTDLGWI